MYLISVFTALYVFFAWRRLDWALIFLIFALPSYLIRFKIFGLPLTLLEVMILSSFAVWFIKNFKNIKQGLAAVFKKRGESATADYPFKTEIIFLLLISYLAAAVSIFSDQALGIWKAYFFEPILLYILIMNVFRDREGRAKIIWAFALSAALVSLLAVYQKFTGDLIFNSLWAAEETRRSVSFFGYPNAVGLYLGPLALLFAGMFFREMFGQRKALGEERSEKLPAFARASAGEQITNYELRIKVVKLFFFAIVFVLSVYAVYCAKSEGALAGMVAGLIFFGLAAGKKARWATILTVVILVGGVCAYKPARELALEKIFFRDLSGRIRLQQWNETWGMLLQGKIIVGSGLANYQPAIAPYHQEGIFFNRDNDPEFHRRTVFNEEYRKKYWQPVETYLYPHNIFLNFWAELGLFGMLLFVWIIIKFYILGFRMIKAPSPTLPRSFFAGEGGAQSEIKNQKPAGDKYMILGLMGAMTVVVVHGLVDVPYFKNDLAAMFWILAAIISLTSVEYEKNIQ